MKQDVSGQPTARDPNRWRLFAWASFAGVLAAIVFVGFPQIDFAVTNLFYGGNRAFIFNFPGVGKDLRVFFKLLFYAATALAIAGLVLSAFFNRKFFAFGFPHWLFLVACLALGPGLTANVILKDNWGRARPFHVQEYGGDQHFTPALARSDQCEDNCSFVSGEASSIFMMFFALAMLSHRRRARLIRLGVLGGTLAGFVRIAQGGHFLSDVVFAGIFMALIAEAVHWAIFDLGGRSLTDAGPVHKSLNKAVLTSARRMQSAAAGITSSARVKLFRGRANSNLAAAKDTSGNAPSPPGGGPGETPAKRL